MLSVPITKRTPECLDPCHSFLKRIQRKGQQQEPEGSKLEAGMLLMGETMYHPDYARVLRTMLQAPWVGRWCKISSVKARSMVLQSLMHI